MKFYYFLSLFLFFVVSCTSIKKNRSIQCNGSSLEKDLLALDNSDLLFSKDSFLGKIKVRVDVEESDLYSIYKKNLEELESLDRLTADGESFQSMLSIGEVFIENSNQKIIEIFLSLNDIAKGKECYNHKAVEKAKELVSVWEKSICGYASNKPQDFEERVKKHFFQHTYWTLYGSSETAELLKVGKNCEPQ